MDRLAITSPSGFAHSNFEDRFQSLWHYDSVLLPRTPRKMSKSQKSHACSLAVPIADMQQIQSPVLQAISLPSTASTADTPHDLLPLFRLMDENKDGEVSLDEMLCLLSKVDKEVSQNYLSSVMETVDQNHDMSVDFSEFIELYRSIYQNESETIALVEDGVQQTDGAGADSDDLLDAFNVYDKNKDGYICAEELAAVLSGLGLAEGTDLVKCQTLITHVDTNGDGLVDLHEFKTMMGLGCPISQVQTSESTLEGLIPTIVCN